MATTRFVFAVVTTATLQPNSQGRCIFPSAMQGQFVLEVSATAEELPVGVLNEVFDDRLVRLVEEVLEVMQADHESHRQAGSPDIFGVK